MKRCKKNKIFPNHVINAFKQVLYTARQATKSKKWKTWSKKSHHFLSNLELDQLFIDLRNLEEESLRLENKLSSKIKEDWLFKLIYQFMKDHSSRISSEEKRRLSKKFNSLMFEQNPKNRVHPEVNIEQRDNWIINLTETFNSF